jgi:hypothetical protein
MFLRRLNDTDFDLQKRYVESLTYKFSDNFDSFQILKNSGSSTKTFMLRGYFSSSAFFNIYYGVTPGSCMAAMQIILENWKDGEKILDLTEQAIKSKLERADYEWLAQFPTYYDLPDDIREQMTRELYDEMQTRIKISE